MKYENMKMADLREPFRWMLIFALAEIKWFSFLIISFVLNTLQVSGVDLGEQEKRLQRTAYPPRIIIGTPKRLLEVVQNNKELFRKTKRIVIDEVDKNLAPLHRRASRKKLWSRAVHPKAAKLLVEELKRISRVSTL